MKIEALDIEGAYLVTPTIHGDSRGAFLEAFRADLLAEAIGHPFTLAQANTSVSARGVVRGIHFALVPPGQAKYVTCPAGAVLDVVVDLRVGSPTYGTHRSVRLDDVDRRALYIAEGLGHGFCALSDTATLHYLCSTGYSPDREFAVHPLDADLGIAWPVDGEPTLSARDASAPALAEAAAAGRLPTFESARAWVGSLRSAAGPPANRR